ncbi:MAG: hypothetical protein ACI9YH_000986 [Colwellia sp.]|jgi:hypothetical protein
MSVKAVGADLTSLFESTITVITEGTIMNNKLYNKKRMNNTIWSKLRVLIYLVLVQTPQISIDFTLDEASMCESHCGINVQINYYEANFERISKII